MDNDMLADHIKMIQHMTVMVGSDEIGRLVSTLNQVDAIMPIIDPTLYRSRMGAHELNKRCVAAFHAYHKELMGIRRDVEGER